jgi:uncharacterized protein (TIGR01244 family)
MAREIEAGFAVAAQLSLADVSAAAGRFALIVNNRPDGEDPTAPQSAAIEAAAREAGIDYVAIPVTHAGFSHAQIDALDAAIRDAGGPVLAYCRSGTRSCFLWALSRARAGNDPEALTNQAASAGYDLSPIRPMLNALAGSGGAT